MAIEEKARFDKIRYAGCWEDADVLLEALAVKKEGAYLSIASGGDNSFALLTRNPQTVIALDISPAQLACVELKRQAFAGLSYEELLAFLGVRASDSRDRTYRRLGAGLTKEAQAFWDGNLALIRSGIIHVGKFERYFHIFRTVVLPLVHSRADVEELLSPHDAAGQKEFYRTRWNSWRWKMLFKIFFSRAVMGRLGRDPEFFKYVEADVAARIFQRAEYALSVLPAHTNPYLEYILTGNFFASLPLYLRKENFEAIRRNLGALKLFRGNLAQALAAFPGLKFDGFNLSDIFEYMSIAEYEKELAGLLAAAQPGSRLVFWNMLADRKQSPANQMRLRFLDREAERLFKQDKAFFYKSLIIGEAI